MNKDDKLKELQTTIDTAKAQMDALLKEPEQWPKDGDIVYALWSDGDIWRKQYNSDNDNEWHERGLIFRTEEEAKLHDERRILLTAILHEQGVLHNPDWKNIRQEKWALHYNYEKKNLLYHCYIYGAHPSFLGVYFKSEKALRDVVEKYRADILRLLVGV